MQSATLRAQSILTPEVRRILARHALPVSDGFMRLPQVLAVFPISKTKWWAGVRAGQYPRSVKLGTRVTAWRTRDIAALLASFEK